VSGWCVCILDVVFGGGPPCALALQIGQPLAGLGIVRGGASPEWAGSG
jgi:hypothetical protein